MAQTNKLRARQTKPLYIKDIRYVAIKKLVERTNLFDVKIMKSSYADWSCPPLVMKSIIPIHHEIHLAASSVTDSIEIVDVYGIKVAALFNVYGSTRTLLNNRQSGTTVYYVDDQVYLVIRKQDAFVNKIEDYAMSYIEDGSRVYYLQKVDSQEAATIMGAVQNRKV